VARARRRITAVLGAGASLVPVVLMADAGGTPTTTTRERSIHGIQVVASDGYDTHSHPRATWALTTLP
jgi:hypothetical protein